MKKYFITGLCLLLPVAVTLAIVIWMVNFLTGPFLQGVTGIMNRYHILQDGIGFISSEQLQHVMSQLLILLVLFGFTILLGALTRYFFVHTLIRASERIIQRIPFINLLYKTLRELFNTLFTPQATAFKQVVMVPYPGKGSFAIGFVTQEEISFVADKIVEVTVFIPTAPNPTSGLLLLYAREDVIYLTISVEQAMKYIISCGIISPN